MAKPSTDYGDDPVKLALEIDRVMRERAPAGWKGDQARETQVRWSLGARPSRAGY